MLTPRDTAMEKKIHWEGGKRGFIPWKCPSCLVLNCIQITLWMFPCSKPLLQIWDGRIIIATQFIVKSWLYLLKKKHLFLLSNIIPLFLGWCLPTELVRTLKNSIWKTEMYFHLKKILNYKNLRIVKRADFLNEFVASFWNENCDDLKDKLGYISSHDFSCRYFDSPPMSRPSRCVYLHGSLAS